MNELTETVEKINALLDKANEISPLVIEELLQWAYITNTIGIVFGVIAIIVGTICAICAYKELDDLSDIGNPFRWILFVTGATFGLLFGGVSLISSVIDLIYLYTSPHLYILDKLT